VCLIRVGDELCKTVNLLYRLCSNAECLSFQTSFKIRINELKYCLCLCRAAIVYLKSSSDAKAAVEDLRNCTSETAGDRLGTKSVTYSPSHGVSMK